MKWISASILFLHCLITNASTSTEKSAAEISNLKNTYLASKQRVLDAEIKERKVMSTLYSLNHKMKKMSRKRDLLTNKMLSANGNAKYTAKEIAVLEKKINGQRKVLSKKLRAIYKLGSSGVLPVLFSASSSYELDRIMKYLKAYSESDYKIIMNYQVNLKKLSKKRKRLEIEVKKLVRFKKDLKRQESQLEEKQKFKSKMLSKLTKRKKIELTKLKTVRKLTKDMVKSNKNLSVSELLDDSFFAVKGSLRPPVSGRLQKNYGIIQNGEFKYKLSHKGHFYNAKPGEDVFVIHQGRVSFQGEIQGYGNTVIVEHGDHYYTVYAKLGDVHVDRGQELEGGEVIASVATSSYVSGIYFEIRHFSDSIDPKNWLIAENEQ